MEKDEQAARAGILRGLCNGQVRYAGQKVLKRSLLAEGRDKDDFTLDMS